MVLTVWAIKRWTIEENMAAYLSYIPEKLDIYLRNNGQIIYSIVDGRNNSLYIQYILYLTSLQNAL